MTLPNITDLMEFIREYPTASFGLIKKWGKWIKTNSPPAVGPILPPQLTEPVDFDDKTFIQLVEAVENRFKEKYKPAMSVVIGEPDFLPFANLSVGQKLGSAVCRITKSFDNDSATSFIGDLKDLQTEPQFSKLPGYDENTKITSQDLAALFPLKVDDDSVRSFVEANKGLEAHGNTSEITEDDIIKHFYEVCATGFLVSRNYILTNYHVFSHEIEFQQGFQGFESVSLSDKRYYAEFGYETDSLSRKTQSIKYPLKRILLHDAKLDYALVELGSVSVGENSLGRMPGDAFGWIRLLSDTSIIAPRIDENLQTNLENYAAEQIKKSTELSYILEYDPKKQREDFTQIQSQGENQVFLEKFDGYEHVRIFDNKGDIVVDKGKGRFTPNDALRKLMAKESVSNDEKKEILQNIFLSLYSISPYLVKRGSKGDLVNIIQHPRGRRKEIVLSNNRLIKMWSNHLDYTTDIDFSSSGSPVFNQQWQLVGLHSLAIKDSQAANEKEYQRGIRTCRIVDNIRNNIISLSQNSTSLANQSERAKLIDLWAFYNSFISASAISLDELITANLKSVQKGDQDEKLLILSSEEILSRLTLANSLQTNNISVEEQPLKSFWIQLNTGFLTISRKRYNDDGTENTETPEISILASEDPYLQLFISSGSDWEKKFLSDTQIALKQISWEGFYWKLDLDTKKVHRVINGDFGQEGPEILLPHYVYFTAAGDNCVISFDNVYIIVKKEIEAGEQGKLSLRISTGETRLSEGIDWKVLELNPYQFKVCQNRWEANNFYWQVDTLAKTVKHFDQDIKYNDKILPEAFVEVVY